MTDTPGDSTPTPMRHYISEGGTHVSRTLPRCAVCNESYSFPGNTNKYHQHLPVLLTCGHMICESCLRTNKTRNFIKCPTCNTLIALTFKRKTTEQFEFNFYVFGLIKFITTFGDREESGQTQAPAVPKCGECSLPVADRKCLQCDSLFCHDCFKTVHQFNVFRSHQSLELTSSVKFQHIPTHCETHPGKQVNFYCETCDKAICLDCKTQMHLIHVVCQLFERNVATQKEIPAYITLLDQLNQLNKMSVETCKAALQKEKLYAQQMIEEISQHFIGLHGSLQLVESQLVKRVKDRFGENLVKIQAMQENLKANQDQIETNMEKVTYYSRNTPYNLDLESLLRDISSFAKEMPCDLNVCQSPHNPFTFQKPPVPVNLADGYALKWDEGISMFLKPCQSISSPPHYQRSTAQPEMSKQLFRDPLREHRQLRELREHREHRESLSREHSREYGEHREFRHKNKERLSGRKAQSEAELTGSSRDSSRPKSMELMDIDEPKVRKHRKLSHREKSRESSGERHSRKGTTLFPKISLLKSIQSESVNVSHIKNPQEIYIQNLTFASSTAYFFEMCANMANEGVKAEEIVANEMYLMKDTSDGRERWYRCELKHHYVKEKLYEVQLIDFGNVRKVTKSLLRTCPDELKNQPRGATQCTLYNIHPKKGQWTDEANCLLSELILSDSVTKMTMGMEGDAHVVDLIVMKNLTPISIRETLVKVNLARHIPTNDPQMLKLISELNKYINSAHTTSPKFYSQTIAVGGYFAPKVIHVVSPLDFYVMKAMDVPMYEEQMYAMDKYYNDRQEQRIYSPENKMPVAINHNGHWHRGEVTSVKGPLQVEVRLVDVGTVITVHLRSLRTLHSDFMKLSKGVIACSLAHVAPCEQNDYQWPREALETFCALTNSDNLELFVHSTHTSKRNTFNVTLYSVRKDKNISINAQLVQLEFATSTGTESVQVEFYKDIEELTDDDPVNATKISIPSTSKDTKRSFRINSKILNIINPGEFYVIFKHNMTLVDQVQRRIQNLMAKSEAPLLPQDWQIDDMCCVRVELPDDPVCEWRRAIVKDIDESSGMYDVFLVDAGVQVRVKKELTAPVPSEKLKATFFAAFLCHLSHIAPTAGSKVWPSSAIDKFKSYCNSKKFEGYAVTMVGRSVNNSIPVVLWGRMEEDDPLQPTIVRWKNINESLVKRGYAHLTEKFPATFDNEIAEMELQLKNHEFQQFIESLNKSSLMETAVIDVDSWESKLTSEITAVLEWKPAEPWKESIFLGVATYVDNNGIIHMYNVKNRNLLDKMRVIADEVLRETLPSPVEQFWAKNQPCMAKYQAEEKFFRGVVRRVDKEKGQCLVQFVDYGNIEEVSFKDMRKNLLFGNIPIQSYRFKFVNLVPIKREEPWPCDVLDKMHAYTTGHECIAMLNGPPEDNGTGLYEMVSLRMGNIDLVDYLLQNDYAARTLPETAATVVQCTQLECLKPDGKTKVKTEPPELDSISKYREYFNQKDIKEQTLLLSENDDFDEEESTDNSDYKEDPSSDESDADEPSPLGGAMKKYRGDDDEESTVEHFNPLYTSTEVPKGREMFPYLELDKDCRGFYGKTTELMSPLELYFCPEIESHTLMHTNMEKCLQDAAAWYTPVDKVNPSTAYLARYDEDGRWYRAIVNSDKIIEDEIYVRFVDYLNTEMVNLKYIKPLHENFQCIPLRNIHVRLADVKVNPRYHAIDAERELRVMLHQKRVYAKIVKIGSPHLVKLYADKDDENVIYQSLIDRRFFVSTGKN